MNKDRNDSKRRERTITWQAQPHPASCEHHYEVIAHDDSAALQRCVKCGSLEAE